MKVDDKVVLKDAQTLRSQMGAGEKPVGQTVTIESLFVVDCEFSTYELATLDNGLVLVIQRVNREKEICLYFSEVNPGSRDELSWLFNGEDYVDEIVDDNEITYKKKFTMWGKGNGQLVGVTEYSTTDKCDNPELLVIETGDGDEGGFVEFFQGCQINSSEMELMEA